ncbi:MULTISPECIES: MFS transporter [unclassified Streptomyces]|uniref:MFS transporter n=1 Tax=unclassified Streptomyces TaxID=2593676 RepID=UPI002ED618CA|nr:MFS transporter [Streptomyces sp. NBC_00891]WSY03604.1 MFS transporter [Streptomyces sp. NBC_00890]WSZ05231.1 MFS transporter [Streptomyces sp. NBC_00869]WSZ27274.1 MFS transporter [Streptomyces sp. NBC_00870]
MTTTVTTSPNPVSVPAPAQRTRLPVRALVGLFLAGFISILTECLPAGLLPEMSRTLGTSAALTGQTVTLYALATALGAIPLARATATWPRKHVLQLALAVVAVTNALTALSDDYALTMLLRFVAGLGTGLIWPLLGGYAARLAPQGRQGRAIAIALAGTPIGLALGIPLGTLLSGLGGWELAFYTAAAVTVLSMAWVLVAVPNLPGQPVENRFRISQVLTIPGLRLILLALATYMVAHNLLYTYITDLLSHIGMAGQTGWVLFTFGVTSVLSVLVVGAHIDRHLRGLTVSSTVLFGAGVLVLGAVSGTPLLVYVAVAAWGFAFGSSPSLFVGAAINATREAADVAQSITITVFSVSIAIGSLLGGLLIAGLGTASLPWAALALLVAAAVTVFGGKRHAFPPNG